MEEKKRTFAGRISRKMLIWMFIIALGPSYVIFHFEGKATREFYSKIYYNKMLITTEYTRRVISDVYVAATNNIYYLEHTLDKPDDHKHTMERIVKSGTRVRSCGISFIKDYYPEKGHRLCSYAWRNAANPDIIWTADMGDADLDYLNTDWFRNVIEHDSAYWSEPFYDGYDEKTTLSAYMLPIHDQEGQTVAALRADISLDWLANKLEETDSTINKDAMAMANKFNLKSQSYIIYQDGTFITNPDKQRIMKDNFFNQIESCDGNDVKGLVAKMKEGKTSDEKSLEKFIVDNEECYLLYTPVKYTNWLIVTVIPCHALDILSYINGAMVFLIFLIAMLVFVMVVYYYIKHGLAPLNDLSILANDIAKGNFDTPLPKTKHNDEISRLRDSIEKMQFKLSNYVDEVKRTKS